MRVLLPCSWLSSLQKFPLRPRLPLRQENRDTEPLPRAYLPTRYNLSKCPSLFVRNETGRSDAPHSPQTRLPNNEKEPSARLVPKGTHDRLRHFRDLSSCERLPFSVLFSLPFLRKRFFVKKLFTQNRIRRERKRPPPAKCEVMTFFVVTYDKCERGRLIR